MFSRLSRIRVRPRSNHSQSLMAGNFVALWSLDPKFSALKDLNPFKIVIKVQEASNILRVDFACSKWPHLHRAYLVTVRKLNLHSVLKIFPKIIHDIITKYLTFVSFRNFGKNGNTKWALQYRNVGICLLPLVHLERLI